MTFEPWENHVFIKRDIWQERGFSILNFVEKNFTNEYKINFKLRPDGVVLIFESAETALSIDVLFRLIGTNES